MLYKYFKQVVLRCRLKKATMALLKVAVQETVFNRGLKLNFGTQYFIDPPGPPTGRIYLPLLEDGIADMTPLWDVIRPTHEKQVRRYLAMKRLLRRLSGLPEEAYSDCI